MKKMLIFLAVVALAVPAFGQTFNPSITEQVLNVELNVAEYAELTVIEPTMILNMEDTGDYLGGAPDAPAGSGQPAELELKANYTTNLVVRSGTGSGGSGTVNIGANSFLHTDDGNGNVLGAWPQIGTVYAGGSIFSHSGSWPLVMDGLTTGTSGDGIPAGTHTIYVGVSTKIENTPTGEWAPVGTYTGSLGVEVVPHPF
jgi:hypothetical protein